MNTLLRVLCALGSTHDMPLILAPFDWRWGVAIIALAEWVSFPAPQRLPLSRRQGGRGG